MKLTLYTLRGLSVRLFAVAAMCNFGFYLRAQEQDFYVREALVTNKNLSCFLKKYIVPIAKANGFNSETDVIIISDGKHYNKGTGKLENDIAINVTASSSIGYKMLYNQAQVFVADIDDIDFFIEYNGYDDSWFRILPTDRLLEKIETGKMYFSLCDNTATWLLLTDSQQFRLINFHSAGLSWLKNYDDYTIYRPELPLKLMNNKLELSDLLNLYELDKKRLHVNIDSVNIK